MAADPDSIYDVLDTVDSAAPHSKMSEMGKPGEEDGVGKRSTSPPGRETREDWRGGEWSRSQVSGETQQKPISSSRSRSRSPERRPRASSRDRQFRYEKEGCNTTSDQPHLQRARLFVGNIEPNRVHRRDLIRLFSQYGDVLGVSVHKGYAFMQMDREKNANKAISALDNRMFMGSRVHVEFSQAALKAGAKFERLSVRESPPPAPPLRDRSADSLAMFQLERDTLRDREERLTRILRMERELAYLRSRDEYYDSVARRPYYDLPDRGVGSIADSYHRLSPPPVPREYSSVMRDYSLPRPGERSLYARPSDRSPFERPPSPGVLHEPVSYPMPASGRPSAGAISSLERRDAQYGGGYNQRPMLSSPAVGYGSNAGSSNLHPSKPGAPPSGAPPPGWPSTMYDKTNTNRAPFANVTPWN